MKLFIPNPPAVYSQSTFNTIFDTIKRSILSGVSVDEAVESVLLQSPDGTVYKVTVSNTGTLTTTVVPLGSR
jgi:hypothetical protein